MRQSGRGSALTGWVGPGCHGQGYFTLTVNVVLGYRSSASLTAIIGYCAGFYILVALWPFSCENCKGEEEERRRRVGEQSECEDEGGGGRVG